MIGRDRNALLAAALFAGSIVELAIGYRADLLAVGAAALITLPVAFRLVWPWIAYAGVAAGLTLLTVAGREPDATAEIIALWALAYTFGTRPSRREAVLGLVAIGVPMGALVVLEDPLEILWVLGVFVLPPWITGRLMFGRQARIDELDELRARLERERELTARLATELERAKLGADIQVVLGHSLSRMSDLAERGGEAVGSDDAEAARAFEGIRAAGTEATRELRRLLGVLRGDANPARPAR